MFLSLMWLCVVTGMVTLITAAVKVQNTSVCKGYLINITGADDEKLFTSKANIEKLLKASTKGDVKGQRMNEFDLPQIEDLLEQSAWVYNAELYFDNTNLLRVNVIERTPLARLFTNVGESFYIDESGRRIPLSEKISLDVPVFTGYPTKKVLNASDSALMQNVIATASFINEDPFWSSQVSQIDISHQGVKGWQMQMVPVVGNHRVQLGDGSDIATKFHRLYLFYDQVLKRKGFDKYQTIDVQYDGQVVGVKGNYSKVDSLQLRKNIENLLVQSRDANELISETPNIGLSNYIIDTSMAAQANEQAFEPAMEGQPAEPEPDAVVETPTAKPVSAPVKKTEEPVKKNTKPAAVTKPEEARADVKKNEAKKVSAKAEIAKPVVKKIESKSATKPVAKRETKKIDKPPVKKETTKKKVGKKEVKPDTKTSTHAKTTTAKAGNVKTKTPEKKSLAKQEAKKQAETNTKKSTVTKPKAAGTKATTKKSNE